MKFALNYSPEAVALLRTGQIEIDLFKCPNWPDMVAEAQQDRPVYIHFPLIAGQRNIEAVGLDQIAEWRATTATQFVNVHLGARVQDLPNIEDANAVVATMVADVQKLVDCFGTEHVIAENVPYPDFYGNKPRIVVEPTVIRRVIETCGCGLLLDLAHARLSSESLGMDVHEYIVQLPIERLREVHITGIGLNRDGQCEDHLPMTETDWALFNWALKQIDSGAWATPAIVACEYGGIGPLFEWRSDAAVIAHDIPRMVAMLRETVEV